MGRLMIRPLTDDEKRTVLLQMVQSTLREEQRRAPELKQLRDTARSVFDAFVRTPVLHVGEAPMPSGMTQAPIEELWSVTPKVTIE
jgi:hypothetical protein